MHEKMAENRTAFEGEYKNELKALMGLSKAENDEITSSTTDLEVYDQLTGNAGERTVNDAKIGLTQNFGATGASCAVHIFQSV